MTWFENGSGRLRVDEPAVRARATRGFRLVVLVTVILLTEPIAAILRAPGAGIGRPGAGFWGHALAALLLAAGLWTGVPVLRWIGAAALLVSGGLAAWEFAAARPGSIPPLPMIHGVLSLIAAGILGLSGSVKLYLAHREVGL